MKYLLLLAMLTTGCSQFRASVNCSTLVYQVALCVEIEQ